MAQVRRGTPRTPDWTSRLYPAPPARQRWEYFARVRKYEILCFAIQHRQKRFP